MKKVIVFLSLLALAGCKKETNSSSPEGVTYKKEQMEVSKGIPVPEASLKNLNTKILQALKNHDGIILAQIIHPEKGVRFSMYGYVNKETDKVFSTEDFLKYSRSPIRFTFGEKDGSGEKYIVSLTDYLYKWVFKRDFTRSQFFLNTFKGSGNSLNNLKEVYPEADFAENYIAGSEKYGGMDWSALRFVFEKFNGKFYLVAVINDEWTI